MTALIVQLIEVMGPLITDIIKDHMQSNNGEIPTVDQIKERFESNYQKYLAEGADWWSRHPRT